CRAEGGYRSEATVIPQHRDTALHKKSLPEPLRLRRWFGLAPKVLDQRSNEGRSPNEERPFRQGRALPHIGAAKPLRTVVAHRGGEAAENSCRTSGRRSR